MLQEIFYKWKNKSLLVFALILLIAINNAYAKQCYCQPNEPCWPEASHWQQLRQKLKGQLKPVESYLKPCQKDHTSRACNSVLQNAKNPFYLEEQAGATQSTGWLGAWQSTASQFAVVAETTGDVVEAVKFARKFNLKLVIKGTGHDYLGRSNAPNSLLIWTHLMRKITMHDSFSGQGCDLNQKGKRAVTVGAGTRWLEVYDEVTTKNGRYVQGGGCTSIGAAGGFTQGGGSC